LYKFRELKTKLKTRTNAGAWKGYMSSLGDSVGEGTHDSDHIVALLLFYYINMTFCFSFWGTF